MVNPSSVHGTTMMPASSSSYGGGNSCDSNSSPFFTVDPARHSPLIVFLTGLISSDSASKVTVSLLILLVALGSGVLPMRMIAQAHHQHHGQEHHHDGAGAGARIHRFLHVLVKYGNSFSAGVFLAMGIVHLMPEATRAFAAVYGDAFVAHYHPGELLVLVGYVLILALHRVVFPTPTCPHALEAPGGDGGGHQHSHSGDDGHGHAHEHGHSHAQAQRHQPHFHTRVASRGHSPPPVLMDDTKPLMSTATGSSYGAIGSPLTIVAATSSPLRRRQSSSCCRSAKHCASSPNQHRGSSPLTPAPNTPFGVAFSDSAPMSTLSRVEPDRTEEDGGLDHLLLDRTERIANAGGNSMGWTLVIALSVHAVCEGLALGLQCGQQNVLMLGSAICSHKWAESFALSSSLMHQAVAPHHHDGDDEVDKSSRPRSFRQLQEDAEEEEKAIHRAWFIVVLFAMSTPIGALIGGVLHSKLPPASAGVVKALSAGTFMYIGASEVVVEEFIQGRQYWGKWICLVCGVVVMYSLNMLFH